MEGIAGYIYPNELHLAWTAIIPLYPFITGIVAGSYLLSAVERLFDFRSLRPIRRLALLVSLGFVTAAPLPLLLDLRHPERAFSVMITPNLNSAMAIFGFAYTAFILVLLAQIWLDYRVDLAERANRASGLKAVILKALTLWYTDTSPAAAKTDKRLGTIVTLIGIPTVTLLSGYVGFIFGSIKANAWWTSPLIPVIFAASAVVVGCAMVLVLYVVGAAVRKEPADARTVRTIGNFLFGALLVAFTLESLDTVHRFYTAEEYFEIVDALIHQRMWTTVVTMQMLLGTATPIVILGALAVLNFSDRVRRVLSVEASLLALLGSLSMRWNVAMGGQSFSRSLRGFRHIEFEWVGRDSVLMAAAIFLLPFVVYFVLVKIIPPWLAPAKGLPPQRLGPKAPLAVVALVAALPLGSIIYDVVYEPHSDLILAEPAAPIEVGSVLPGTFRPESYDGYVIERDPPLEPEEPEAAVEEEPTPEPVEAGEGSGSGA